MRRPWTFAEPGEWHQPRMRDFGMRCCDCGLAHRVDFRIVGRRVQMRAWRDERSTAAIRREARKRKRRAT
jgi:hypothetical protein